ncbi:conserved hypothetical protein [Brochothrix thermosphacta]|nr:conserved hypothetical protein [Brochothrix thermosphacta]
MESRVVIKSQKESDSIMNQKSIARSNVVFFTIFIVLVAVFIYYSV